MISVLWNYKIQIIHILCYFFHDFCIHYFENTMQKLNTLVYLIMKNIKHLACLYNTHSTIDSFLMGLEISWLTCMNNSIEQHTSVIASLSYPCMYLWLLSCNDYRNYHFHHFCFFLSFFCLISCTDLFL